LNEAGASQLMRAAPENLPELVAPLSVADFKAMVVAGKPHHMPGDPARAECQAALFDWDALIDGVRDGTFPVRDLRIYKDRAKLPNLLLKNDPAERAALIERLLAANASVILNHVQTHVPAIGRLCEAVAGQTREHISAAAIATSGDGGALKLHFDEYDIIVLQLDGAKKWEIYDDPVVNPVNGMSKQIDEKDRARALEIVLQPGDWLYVPAGWAHRCDTAAARSLHLGIMFYPFTAVRAIELLMRAMIADPSDRAPLRFDENEAEATEAKLRERLLGRIQAMSLQELIRLHQAGSDPRSIPQSDQTLDQDETSP